MKKSTKAQVKRAGDAKSGKPAKDAVAPPAPAGTTASGAQWSASGQGGNVLQWLTQKTQAEEVPQSRGAVEYLTKLRAQESKRDNKAAETTKKDKSVKAKTSERQSPAPAPAPAPVPVNQPVPKPRSQGVAVSTTATASAATEPIRQKAWTGEDHIQKLAQIFPDKAIGVSKAGAPPPSAPSTAPAASADAACHESQSSKEVGGPRRVRGRLHQNDRAERARELERKAQENAMKHHEEALRTDPEYQKQFQTFQELQRTMEESRSAFFEHYGRQETIRLDRLVTERLDMPIILDLIEQHDVVFICTDTGSGKSTTVPKALLEMSPDTHVVSTQPRRTATAAIATRVAQMRRESVGEDVGYWIRGEKKGDAQTRLWYMTSYTLLLRILENPSELPFTHIVLDEFHERQPDLEVTVALLRLALLNGLAHFKLIIMSATLNTDDWEGYFDGLKVASYKQSEPEHPIHDYFLEDVCGLLGGDYQCSANLVQKPTVDKPTLDKHIYIAQTLLTFLNQVANPMHSILVFLPGRAQVEMMQVWLETHFHQRIDAIPWHSAVDLADIEHAMKRFTPGRQKVYLATDIAEVSVTLPDVVFVIDMVLVKRPKISKDVPASYLYPPLVLQWISKDSVAQRRGRVGRVQQGFYFCLFPTNQIADLPNNAQPPVENARIDELSLHCLQVVSNPVAIFSVCHGQPLVETIDSSMNTLSNLGCILDVSDPLAPGQRIPEIHNAETDKWSQLIVARAEKEVMTDIPKYQCTFLGRILQLIPVSPQPGMLVFFGFLTGLESLMILAAAVTSSLSPFTVGALQETRGGRKRFNLPRAMEETENVMRDLCCGLRSDVVATMKATLQFRLEVERNGGNQQTVRQWCTQKQLSYEKLAAIVDLENHIKYELASFTPFRDVSEPQKLLEQLDKLATLVVVMTTVAFVSQAVEVTSEGDTYTNSKESALGMFSDLSAVPDIHSPSCLRWQMGDIIIPIQLNLMFDKLLAGFSTAVASPKQFWMSLLLFAQRLQYAMFSDDDGTFAVFAISYCGKERYLELDEVTCAVVLEFRRHLSAICEVLRLLHMHKDVVEEQFVKILAQYNLKPLHEGQRAVITALATIFNKLDEMNVDEVEHEEDDLDTASILSFALPQRNL